MFKASIILVLLAFAALAYGWIVGNDAVLYGSIGASALAGLALLRATMADRRTSDGPGADRGSSEFPDERPVVPERSHRQRAADAEFLSPAPRSRPRRKQQVSSEDITRQLELADQPEDLFDSPAVSRQPPPAPPPARPPGPSERSDAARQTPVPPPVAAPAERTTALPEESAAADDFRTRLAAVLGSAEEPPGEVDRPQEPALSEPQEPQPAPAGTPAAGTRGRKRPEQPVVPAEPGADEPEWIRLEDVPRITRATQPGGGFSRSDVPESVTYRPRRPGSGGGASPKTPGTQPRRAEEPAASQSAGDGVRGKGAKPSLTRVSATDNPATKRSGNPEDGSPKRRGRPPKPKP